MNETQTPGIRFRPLSESDAAEANTERYSEELLDSNGADPFVGALDSTEKVRIMAEAAYGVRAEDIAALDLRELTIIADYFLICTGKSSIQIRAIADRIEDKLRELGLRKLRIEGYQEATWILLDYGDVVVHAMAAEQREFYRIEEFWAEAPRLELDLKPDTPLSGTGRFQSLNAPETVAGTDGEAERDESDDLV